MNISSYYPTQEDAEKVVSLMTNIDTLSSMRLKTGEQYFVYAVKTTQSDYVIRMTVPSLKHKFISGIYWQEKLIPLGIPLAKFIQSDLDGKYSTFPSLLMKRLPGDDLCNVYLNLTSNDKKNLAKEIVIIQALTKQLPDGSGYGFADSYQQELPHKTWYDFLLSRLQFFVNSIEQNGIYDTNEIMKVISIMKNLEEDLKSVRATPFLYDASERNVLVHDGKISGIVDVDDMCFGDPLLVLALTHVSLEIEGYDTLYCDYWAEELELDQNSQIRLAFYKLFYTVMFMHKQSMVTSNCQTLNFDVNRLKNIFHQSLLRMKEFEL